MLYCYVIFDELCSYVMLLCYIIVLCCYFVLLFYAAFDCVLLQYYVMICYSDMLYCVDMD